MKPTDLTGDESLEEIVGMHEEALLVNPDEKPPVVKEPVREVTPETKYVMRGDRCQIDFETRGRFLRNEKFPVIKGIPGTAYLADYRVKEVSDIGASNEEDLLENIIAILDRLNQDGWTLGDGLLEDLLEVLVGMKVRFNTKAARKHKHRWLCECQSDIPDQHRKMSEMEIDLTDNKLMNYISIYEIDERLQEREAGRIKELDEESFQTYVRRKYGARAMTRDEVIADIKLREPIGLWDDQGILYRFRFTRVSDMVIGLKAAADKFNWKIRQVQQRYTSPVGLDPDTQAKLEYQYNKELDKVRRAKQKYSLLAIKAQSLISVSKDGEDIDFANDSLDEKITNWEEVPKSVLEQLSTFLSRYGFGIQGEVEVRCNLEGCGRTDRRSLQRVLSPIELLPFDDADRTVSGRALGQHTEFDILLGD